MTAGLSGGGTEVDPWLITNRAEFRAVVRDAASSGYYELTADMSAPLAGDAPLAFLTEFTSIHGAKVIRGNGYGVRVAMGFNNNSNVEVHVFRNVHFEDISLIITFSGGSARALHVSDFGSFRDVAIYLGEFSASSNYLFGYIPEGIQRSLVSRVMRRVVLARDAPATVPSSRIISNSYAQPTAEACYALQSGTGTLPPGFLRISALAAFSVAGIKALSMLDGTAYEDAGWDNAGDFFLPGQADPLNLIVTTVLAGAGASRPVYASVDDGLKYLGDTNAEGHGEFLFRLKRRAALSVVAGEDSAAAGLRSNMWVDSGKFYLPPAPANRVVRAGASGAIGSISGADFSDGPVTISGITFTPVPINVAVMSPRLLPSRDGFTLTVELSDAGGGGGPIIEGDPAYLDGVVEEIHPALGTVRPLANSEVAVIERRGDQYVAMGRALTNLLGEFRVNTEVYGGGDVFAFAVDFPGLTWQPGIELGIGARVRPTVNNGYVYEVISGGVSGPFEPTWWADAGDGTEGFIGTARAKARPYYQPQAHGPLKMTLIT